MTVGMSLIRVIVVVHVKRILPMVIDPIVEQNSVVVASGFHLTLNSAGLVGDIFNLFRP
jgi:hypothetical protein